MQFNDGKKRGFDVSAYQDDNLTVQKIDFQKMKLEADFVIIRAGQGNWVDEDFQDNWRAAREAGLLRASYWFYDPRFGPRAQARLFASLFKQDRPEGRLWVDLEFPDKWGGSYWDWGHWRTFIDELQAESGLRVGIYTGNWWWRPHATVPGADMGYFGKFPLWVAEYRSDYEGVILPRGWLQAMMWQDGTPAIGLRVGVESKEIDHDKWNSNFDFAQEWSQAEDPNPIPEPQGETMSKYYKWTSTAANIRSGPSTSYGIIGNLVQNDVIQVDEPFTGTWAKITTAQHADGSPVALKSGALVIDRTDCWCTNSYLKEVASLPNPPTTPPDEPPVDPPPGPTKVHQIDIYDNGQISEDGGAIH